jgi:hypothetical protein
MRSGSVAAVLITMGPPMQYPVVPILRRVSTAFCASSQATKAFASDTCVVALSVVSPGKIRSAGGSAPEITR